MQYPWGQSVYVCEPANTVLHVFPALTQAVGERNTVAMAIGLLLLL